MDRIRILITVGETQYGVLAEFAKELKAGFEEAGCIVDWFDVRPLSKIEDAVFAKYKNREYDFVLVFNQWMVEVRELFVRSSSTIFWSFIVDSPLYHLNRLQSCSENVIVSFIDKNHVAYAERELKHLSNITFMPHGGSRPKKINSYRDRKKQIVFFGSYTDIKKLYAELQEEREPWNYLMERAVRRSYDEETDFINIIEEELHVKEQKFTGYQRKLALLRFKYIYQLVRNLKRVHLLEFMGAAGIPVEVYGNGWEDYENKYPEWIHIHKAVEFEQTLEIMSDAKIVLNHMPLYVNGSHERVFTAMLCGAVSFSEENIYFRQEFEENREIVFFKYQEIEKVSEKIAFLLEHEMLAEHIADRGRKKAEKLHTWEIRAKAMLDMLLKVKKEQARQEKFCIKAYSECDEAWNRLLFRIQNTDEAGLYEMMKQGYIGDALFDGAAELLLEESFARYPYWGELKAREGNFGVCAQRVYQLKNRMEEFVWLYGRLEDETSRKVLLTLLQYWLRYTSLEQMPDEHWRQYFDMDIIRFSKEEVFVDCGAYNGDTFAGFTLECKQYRSVYCYEFDENNLMELRKTVDGFSNVTIRPCAVGNESGEISVWEAEDHSSSRLNPSGEGRKVPVVSLDEDIAEKITFIKADIEGAEKSMLQGAKNHIMREKPKLAIAVYHGNSDILDVPLLIEELNPDYKLYLRNYGGGLYPNEIILYAV